jgi:hypothetical protein
MKDELRNNLGYSTEYIAKLKPIEASLILQHQTRDASAETLAELVHEYEEQQLALQLQQQQEVEAAAATAAAAAAAAAAQPESLSRQQSFRSSLFTNYVSQNELVRVPKSSPATSTKKRVWYELVERQRLHNGNSQVEEEEVVVVVRVLGLYPSETEAQEGLETLQYFAQRNHRTVDFEIRQTTR